MYKETINDVVTHIYGYYKANTSSPYVLTTDYGTVFVPNHKKTSGVDTPSYRKLRRSGALLPFTNFLQVENKGKSSEYDVEVKNVSSGTQYRDAGPNWSWGSEASLPFSSSVFGDKTSENVIMQAAGARQVSSAWDVLTFAAEIGQTVQMFRSLAGKLQQLLASKPVGTPWDLWLEGRYGWRSLLFDINDITDALSKASRPKTTKTTAGQSVSWNVTTSSSNPFYSSSIATRTVTSSQSYTMNSRGSVVTRGAPPRFNVNPVKTAWEVTRLSFVLDWFINVGRAIDATQFALTTTDSTSGFGSRIESNYSASIALQPATGWVKLADTGEIHVESYIERRAPSSVPLIPLVSVNLDRFKVLDLVSLVVQAARR